MSRRATAAAILLVCVMPAAPAGAADCREARPLPLRVRFANEPPRDALLQATHPTGLQLLAATDRRVVWSVGPSGHTQRATLLDAGFGASLAAIHLDTDGIHDRIYAGDSAGRLWRFDLQSGADPARWMRITLLADLGAPNRGFIAAPDVTRITTSAGTWLSIAIGTASIGAAQAQNRFYVLRDSLDAAVPAAPLTESDLESMVPAITGGSSGARGWFLKLGTAQVLAQSLTLQGRTWFTTVHSARPLASACAPARIPTDVVPVSVAALDLEHTADGQPGPGGPQVGHRDVLVAGLLPADSVVRLSTQPAPPDGHVPCLVGTRPVPGCSLDTRPQRTWWLREDAD